MKYLTDVFVNNTAKLYCTTYSAAQGHDVGADPEKTEVFSKLNSFVCKRGLKVLQQYVNELQNKITMIEWGIYSLVKIKTFTLWVFTESHTDSTILDKELLLDGYMLFEKIEELKLAETT